MAETASSKPPEAVISDSAAMGRDNIFFVPAKQRITKLPALLDHFNSKDLKTLFKCTAAAWIYTLFIVINPTLRVLGQASFFGAIVLFMAPPSGVILVGFLASATLLIGVCLGWAWGTITMKAALATRPAADLQARYIELQRLGSSNTTNSQQASGQSTYTQIAVYNGFFLDTRVSVTYFCMIGLFIYLVSRLRVKAPKMTLLVMFSIIISDIYLTIAPLIPTFTGTIPQVLIKPAAVATGVSIVCNIIFFPRSTSHIILDDMQTMLSPMKDFIQACLIDLENPSKHFDLDRLKESRKNLIELYRAMSGNLAFLSLDASMGRFSADDIKEIAKPLRQVVVMFLGLTHVQVARRERNVRDRKILRFAGMMAANQAPPHTSLDGQQEESPLESSPHIDAKDVSAEEFLEPDLKSLAKACGSLLPACEDAVLAITESLHNCNTRRWIKRPSKEECQTRYRAHANVLDNLRKHKTELTARTAGHLWEDYRHHFDDNGQPLPHKASEPTVSPIGELMLSLVLEERILNLANALEAMLACIVALEQRCTRTRLWLPGGLHKLFALALHDDQSSAGGLPVLDSASERTLVEEKEKEKEKESSSPSKAKKSKKNPRDIEIQEAVSRLMKPQTRGGRKRSKSGKVLLAISHWFSSTEGLYALRVLVATIVLGVIAVVPSSAGFYYREKGLWGLIMAQTGLLPYTADFVFGFITRLLGTVIGAVIGLIAWYIGAGNGPGNSYGIAAVMAVVIVVLMWMRLFSSPAALQGVILTAATCYLIVGYSWDDTHIPSYGNPGVGYSVFWRRMLLVMIGFGVAAFVTLFPRPPSANRHYRRLLAEALSTIQNQYSLICLTFSAGVEDLEEVAEKAAINLGTALLEIEPTIALVRLEYSSSNFDAGSLQAVCRFALNLNYSATQLLLYIPQLPPHLKARFKRVTGVNENRMVADVMTTLTIAQASLKTGDPLPVLLPLLASLRLGHAGEQRNAQADVDEKGVPPSSDLVFSQESLSEEGVRKYFSAIAMFVQFLGSVDELIRVLKDAVGESGDARLLQEV